MLHNTLWLHLLMFNGTMILAVTNTHGFMKREDKGPLGKRCWTWLETNMGGCACVCVPEKTTLPSICCGRKPESNLGHVESLSLSLLQVSAVCSRHWLCFLWSKQRKHVFCLSFCQREDFLRQMSLPSQVTDGERKRQKRSQRREERVCDKETRTIMKMTSFFKV